MARPRSAQGSKAFCWLPSCPQILGVLSRPTLTIRPSRVNSSADTPPACAGHDFTSLPFSISHRRIVPSSLPVASRFESVRQETLVTEAVCPVSVRKSRPVAASQTTTPPLRSLVASSTPSGQNEVAMIQSVCFRSSCSRSPVSVE